jgi:hypothetical protein
MRYYDVSGDHQTNMKFSFSVRTMDRWKKRLPDKIKQVANQEDNRKRLKNLNF